VARLGPLLENAWGWSRTFPIAAESAATDVAIALHWLPMSRPGDMQKARAPKTVCPCSLAETARRARGAILGDSAARPSTHSG
jgi:hypothetical protein